MFNGETGGTLQSWCCSGGLAIGVGGDVLIGGVGGGALYDVPTGTLIRTFPIADPNRRGVLGLARIGDVLAIAATAPVGIHLFDADTAQRIGFVGTNHGNARRFGSAMAVDGARLAVTEVPQVNVFDLGFGVLLGTIDSPAGFPRGNFGTALAYAGGLLVVGAPASSSAVGVVHLFDATGTRVQSLTADGVGIDFGRSVAALGRSVAVGAPTVDGSEVVIFSPCGDGLIDAPVEQCDGGPDCDDACRLASAGGDVCGDADGSGVATVSDGVQILRAAAGLPSPCTPARCDVDGNGAVGLTDGVQVLRFAAGLPTAFRCALHTASRMP